MESLYTNFDNY